MSQKNSFFGLGAPDAPPPTPRSNHRIEKQDRPYLRFLIIARKPQQAIFILPPPPFGQVLV